ncbi:hypothetical protein L198_05235 [Cryptococcus wingfieldii CBS 7118]|uniref:Zn(2)-C6 fungal-type domain-containing protein n=1 Tax=Cryptococcus wingfieldii CBS 7118 TaxID=1295528 RepID=A0A1E3J2N3_9TREE|nr:hypothetical protein L198_05235 [Cryptococcus wingfieldii CBS 7118]ODN94376.1 hypothetical protein L198_05235 [Cryptococcus wingfieldii CBS 7118]
MSASEQNIIHSPPDETIVRYRTPHTPSVPSAPAPIVNTGTTANPNALGLHIYATPSPSSSPPPSSPQPQFENTSDRGKTKARSSAHSIKTDNPKAGSREDWALAVAKRERKPAEGPTHSDLSCERCRQQGQTKCDRNDSNICTGCLVAGVECLYHAPVGKRGSNMTPTRALLVQGRPSMRRFFTGTPSTRSLAPSSTTSSLTSIIAPAATKAKGIPSVEPMVQPTTASASRPENRSPARITIVNKAKASDGKDPASKKHARDHTAGYTQNSISCERCIQRRMRCVRDDFNSCVNCLKAQAECQYEITSEGKQWSKQASRELFAMERLSIGAPPSPSFAPSSTNMSSLTSITSTATPTTQKPSVEPTRTIDFTGNPTASTPKSNDHQSSAPLIETNSTKASGGENTASPEKKGRKKHAPGQTRHFLSCERCRQRRKQCEHDGFNKCNRCLLAGAECLYHVPTGKRGSQKAFTRERHAMGRLSMGDIIVGIPPTPAVASSSRMSSLTPTVPTTPTKNPSGVRLTIESTVKPTTVKPTTVRPAVEPAVISTVQSTVEPAVQPIVEPDVTPTIEPSDEPYVEPSVGPDPDVKPTIKVEVESPVEPSPDPAVAPAAAPFPGDVSAEFPPSFTTPNIFAVFTLPSWFETHTMSPPAFGAAGHVRDEWEYNKLKIMDGDMSHIFSYPPVKPPLKSAFEPPVHFLAGLEPSFCLNDISAPSTPASLDASQAPLPAFEAQGLYGSERVYYCKILGFDMDEIFSTPLAAPEDKAPVTSVTPLVTPVKPTLRYSASEPALSTLPSLFFNHNSLVPRTPPSLSLPRTMPLPEVEGDVVAEGEHVDRDTQSMEMEMSDVDSTFPPTSSFNIFDYFTPVVDEAAEGVMKVE